MKIYLDNAATTETDSRVIESMLPYMSGVYGNASSLHHFGREAAAAVDEARAKIAKIFNAKPQEIYITSGGTESDNWALRGVMSANKKIGKHMITTVIEHPAIMETCKLLEKEGYEITYLKTGSDGRISLDDLKSAVRDDTVLVSVMFANNEMGAIQPIKEIGAFCKENGIIFHTDAVQAAGHLKIDVENQNIDMLSLSAHKFHGPKGIGVLYARKGIPLSVLIEGGAQERGKRAGTENIPAIMGMAAALEEACRNAEENAKKVSAIRDRLIDGLSKIPHSVLNGDAENRLPGNVNFCFEGIEGESLLLLLDDKGICASSGSACTSGSLDPSHVLLAIGRPHEIAHGSLRLSISEENTLEEAEYTIKAVSDVVELLRGISPVWRDLVTGKKEFVIK